MRRMITLTDVHEQIEQIDQKIIDLLEERARLCKGIEIDPDDEAEMVALWEEEGDVRGLDEVRMGRIGKLVAGLCRGPGM
ncbi:chorismate mutase [Candidatus Peregrinibacteria bacterium]|nr:chorismate mutase [Candidatus Peregrinibacteria bacterium]